MYNSGCYKSLKSIMAGPAKQEQLIPVTALSGELPPVKEQRLFSMAEQYFLENIGLIPDKIHLNEEHVKERDRNRGLHRRFPHIPISLSATFIDPETGGLIESEPVKTEELYKWFQAESLFQKQLEARQNPRYQEVRGLLEESNHLPAERTKAEEQAPEAELALLFEELANFSQEQLSQRLLSKIKEVITFLQLQNPKDYYPRYRLLVPVSLLALAAWFCTRDWPESQQPTVSTAAAQTQDEQGVTVYESSPVEQDDYCERDNIKLPEPFASMIIHFNEYGPFTVITPGETMTDILRKFGEVFDKKGFWNAVELIIQQYASRDENRTDASGGKVLYLIP